MVLALGLIVCQAGVSEAASMGTAFTYQGHLYDANQVADGLYDFQFKLFDDPNVVIGNQVGSDVNVPDVDVIDAHFTVELDFGSDVFEGDARWLEIGVRPGDQNDPNVYTTLSPRQEVTPTPYAIYAKTAGGIPGGITGSGTGNYIARFTGSSTIGNSVIYQSGTNVGIGTPAPQYDLDVSGDIRATGTIYGTATDAEKVGGVYAGSFESADDFSVLVECRSFNFRLEQNGSRNLFKLISGPLVGTSCYAHYHDGVQLAKGTLPALGSYSFNVSPDGQLHHDEVIMAFRNSPWPLEGTARIDIFYGAGECGGVWISE